MLKKRFKEFAPVILLFIILNGLFTVGRTLLDKWNADRDVLIFGNFLLFLITAISYVVAVKGLTHTNPNVFVRSVYGSIMLKMFLCLIAAAIYIVVYKSALNKPAFFTCIGLYLVYTFIEVSVLMKLLKQNAHG